MTVRAEARDQVVLLTVDAGDGLPTQIELTPEQCLGLSGQLAASKQFAIQNGAQGISTEVAKRERLEIGPWSFEVAGSRDGRAAVIMQPENWLRMEFELKADGARKMAESLIHVAEFLEGGAVKH